MKSKYILIGLAILLIGTAETAAQKSNNNTYPKFNIGVHTGLDIGAAAPYPPSSLGSESKISAVPYLTPALGFSANLIINDQWSLSMESTYKKFGIDAKAWVTDQRFIDIDDPERIISFRGTAKVQMKFSLLEIPVYAGYSFNKGKNRLVLGPYFAYVFSGEFDASPQKGMLVNVNNPDDFAPVSPEEPFTQNFSDNLSNWDIGMLIGYEWRVIEKMYLGARLSVGFKDVFKPDAKYLTYDMIHMRGTLTLSYRIFNF